MIATDAAADSGDTKRFDNLFIRSGSALNGYLGGFGALGTFAKFLFSLGVSGAEAAASVVFLPFLLFPPCLLATAIFHDQREPEQFSRLSRDNIALAIPLSSPKVE